jgi:SAM-dependent methyltransferase
MPTAAIRLGTFEHATTYDGGELELFAGAVNWKRWFAAQMAPYIRGRVLEVGAGIGGNIPFLMNDRVTHWLALEPDPAQMTAIRSALRLDTWRERCEARQGTIDTLPADVRFDTILYVDVLEHIRDDAQELARAARHLAPGGNLIVLSPAHQFLFSPFDAAIGHFRRYSRDVITRIGPPGCETVALRFLDTAGMLLSLGNRLLTRAAMPTPRQILLWDRLFVRLSRWLDPLTAYRIGKSVLVVWTKAA